MCLNLRYNERPGLHVPFLVPISVRCQRPVETVAVSNHILSAEVLGPQFILQVLLMNTSLFINSVSLLLGEVEDGRKDGHL